MTQIHAPERDNTDDYVEDVDDEGLLRRYDVILCGTDLVQSILASALARAGQTVLHVDGNDRYGGLDTTWTVPDLLETMDLAQQAENTAVDDASSSAENPMHLKLYPGGSTNGVHMHSVKRRTSWLIGVGSHVVTPYGKGVVVSGTVDRHSDDDDNNSGTLTIELSSWTLANGKCPRLYVGLSDVTVDDCPEDIDRTVVLWKRHRIRAVQADMAARILDDSRNNRSLALDVSPQMLFASGSAVDGLLKSNVSEYLEFKSLEGMLYAQGVSSSGGNSAALDNITLTRVPCSKNDVFRSKILSPMDKRRLMKFLQASMDYATAASAAEEERQFSGQGSTVGGSSSGDEKSNNDEHLLSWNERHLNQGRSLARPQNKSVAGSTDLQRLYDHADLDFETYLSTHQKLSPSLTRLVRYALALDNHSSSSNVHTTGATKAATTTVSEGMQQLCAHMQALGRYGGTAFLVPLYGSGELSQAFCRSAAVFGATYLLRRPPIAVVSSEEQASQSCTAKVSLRKHDDENDSDKVEIKQVACSHVVLAGGALRTGKVAAKRVLRRISILCGKPIVDFGEDPSSTTDPQPIQQRHAVIFPPNTIHAQQTHPIHGLLLDEAVKVAPFVSGGCTVVHLTLVVDGLKSIADAILGHDMLDRAHQLTLDTCRQLHNSAAPVDEIFHVSFSYPITDVADFDLKMDGVHKIERPAPGLSVDAAFRQADALFQKICPGKEFLAMAQKVDVKIRETLGEDAFDKEDEEKTVLESAVGMINPVSGNS